MFVLLEALYVVGDDLPLLRLARCFSAALLQASKWLVASSGIAGSRIKYVSLVLW
jgi:hypothetical protein